MWKVWKNSAWLGTSIMISKETSLAEIIGQILILTHLRSLGLVLAFAYRQTLVRWIRTKYPCNHRPLWYLLNVHIGQMGRTLDHCLKEHKRVLLAVKTAQPPIPVLDLTVLLQFLPYTTQPMFPVYLHISSYYHY